MDECKDPDIRKKCVGKCINTIGSYTCVVNVGITNTQTVDEDGDYPDHSGDEEDYDTEKDDYNEEVTTVNPTTTFNIAKHPTTFMTEETTMSIATVASTIVPTDNEVFFENEVTEPEQFYTDHEENYTEQEPAFTTDYEEEYDVNILSTTYATTETQEQTTETVQCPTGFRHDEKMNCKGNIFTNKFFVTLLTRSKCRFYFG